MHKQNAVYPSAKIHTYINMGALLHISIHNSKKYIQSCLPTHTLIDIVTQINAIFSAMPPSPPKAKLNYAFLMIQLFLFVEEAIRYNILKSLCT